MTMNATALEAASIDESVGLTAAACLFHGFSDPSRLSIVRHLAQAFGDPARRSDVFVPDDDQKLHMVWSGMPGPSAG